MEQTYYFDLKGTRRHRDRTGQTFYTMNDAIAHSVALAKRIRSDGCAQGDPELAIVVVLETGQEIHREYVFPQPA